LDNEERQRFARSGHEYLIETVQFTDFENIDGNDFVAHLDFNHPTKYVAWFVQPMSRRRNDDGRTKVEWNNFSIDDNQTLKNPYLRLNYYNRTDPDLGAEYYNYIQPYWHFNSTPPTGLYAYSFALKPLEQQPTSSLNLSRIDDFSIVMGFTNELINYIRMMMDKIYLAVYVVSYNILRFFSGMAALAFQNSL
jgi:hypothetical protein